MMTSVAKNPVVPRALLAASVLGVFVPTALSAAALPLPGPPPYGGSWHPWMAIAVLAGVLAGAVFFASPWWRAQATATAVAYLLFELSYGISRMPVVSPVGLPLSFRPWLRCVEFGVGVGAIVFLCLAAAILESRRKPAVG